MPDEQKTVRLIDGSKPLRSEVTMKANVGVTDKSVRIVVGALLIVLTLMGTIGVWGWIGIVPLVTGLMNFCPLYTVMGANTCKKP
jgi:hypothetical protein